MKKKRVSAQDFTSEMLPKNRVEVYKDIIKNHFGKMLWLGLVLFISLLPMHIFIINKDLSLLSLFSELKNGLITEEVFSQQKISLNQMLSLFNVLSLIIFGIGLSGSMRIFKRLSFMEPTRVFYDFSIGLKQNIKQYMYIFLIMGLWILASTFIYHLSIVNESVSSHALYTILGLLPFAAGILIALPTLLFTIVNISIYSHKIATQIKLGLLSYLSNVSKTLLGTLIVCIPFSIYFFPNIILHMIGMFLVPLALPFLLLGWYLFSLNILDKTINEEHYPELVKKGVLGLENHQKEQ